MADNEPDPIFDQMQFDYDVAATAVQDAMESLTKAVSAGKSLANNRREDFVGAGITDLNTARELVPNAVEKLGVVRGSAKVAAYNMASVKVHKDEIVAAIKQIASWEKALLKLDTVA